jgi:hypothetical protein
MRRLLLTLTAFFVLATPAQAGWVWPVSGEVITPYRNGTDPYANGQHRGVDIAAPTGTPVVAAAGGEVRFAGTAGSSGLTISIRTGDGYDTSYLHLSSLAIRAGTQVSAGDRIGAVGTSGTRSAPAPHLHFGVRDAGTRHDYHDPLAFLPSPPPPAPAPEPPAPAPATAPEPAPPAATPVTVPRAAPNPHAVPRARPHPNPHAPHPVPHARPHPVPRAVPLLRRNATPRAAPTAGALPAPRRSPDGAPAGRAAQRTAIEPGTAPPRLSTLGRAVHALSTPGLEPHPLRSRSAPHRAAGPDIGWIAACIGLLLGAGLLGLTGDRGTPTSTRIRALVRPLAARR